MKKKIYLIASLTTTLLLTSSCGNEPSLDKDIQLDEIEVNDELVEDIFESPDMDYHLPSALQVASIFKKSGMDFNAEAINPTENSSNYTTAASQMLNFGVYSADIAYCVTNDQMNEARELIVVIKELADAQGMSAVFDNIDLMNKFESSLGTDDSIQYVMIEIHERTEEYMLENQMLHTSAVHYAGAWIEGMHLGVTDHINNTNNENVGFQIIEQMEILKNIIKGLKDPKNNDIGLEDVISDLENIQSTYAGFESVKTFQLDESLANLHLLAVEFNELAELIKSLRLKVISA